MKKQHLHHMIRLLVLTAAASFAMVMSAFASETGIITGDVVNARKGPGTNYERVEMLAKGKQVTILGIENGWYHIAWGNDKGYVLSDYVATNSSSAQVSANATVTGGTTINVRSGPGTGYSRVAMVGAGKRVAVLGEESGWYKVSFDGKSGYILSDFVNRDGSAASASASAPAAQTQDTSGNASVTGGTTINVRSGPGTGYSRVAMVGAGKRVSIFGEEGGWYKVSFDGKTGYILSDFVNPDAGALDSIAVSEAAPAVETQSVETQSATAETPAETAIPVAPVEASSVEAVGADDASEGETNRGGFITGGTINVRSGPGTDYDRVAQLYTGKRINILGEENGWFHITCDVATGYVLGEYVYEGDSLPVSSVGEQVAAMAQQYLGTRYVYGGASPSGFDCSGFTLYLYRQFGYSLPHTASGQYANCGYKVSKSELQPGDLVFFTSSGNGGRINHVGIYIGNGNVIHARMSIGQVYINNLSESYYSRNYVGAVRIA